MSNPFKINLKKRDFGHLNGRKVLVFDTETSGLDPVDCDVLELGVVISVNGRIVSASARRYNATSPIPEQATAVNGISNEDVQDAPYAGSQNLFIEPEWHDETVIKAAYNAPFDVKFLNEYCPLGRYKFFDEVMDPFVWVKEFDKYEKGKKLKDACSRRGIQVEMPLHSALTDAILTTHLLWHMASEHNISEKWAERQEKARERQERDYAAWKARNGRV